MEDQDNRKSVIFSRHYRMYMPGEVAKFSSEEANKIVSLGFGKIEEEGSTGSVEESEGEEKTTSSPKPRRTKYVDRMMTNEAEKAE